MRSRHGADQAFTCGALGCFKRGISRWTFSRLDKLTDHIRAMHAYAAPFSGCPSKDRGIGPLPLDLLGAHVQRAHPHCVAEARSILNATTAGRRKCPLSGCNNKIFPLDTFIVHLQGHEAEDVHAARSNWCFESLAFTFAFVSGTSDSAITGVTIGIACPACSTVASTFEQFRLHLWASHLLLDSSQGHSATDHSLFSLGPITQYLSLMKPSDQIIRELGPVRMQILRLYPMFLTHPIFDDCA
jgi:hypothetical protein